DSYYSTEWSSTVKTIVKPGLSGPPLNVAFNSRGKTSLQVSWRAPEERLQNVELTGYQVCFYTRDTAPECLVLTSTKVLSLTLNNLKPSTKYFVTVSASTKAGYGEKSLEVTKITSGEPVNPLTTSDYTLSLNIPKPAEYIREVMVILQLVTSSQTPSENIRTSEFKPYQTSTRDPYITAYLKSDVLPLTFVIGDGREYNSEKEKYFNQPLEQNSSYLVFLRFFESQDSYYSTEWSNSVKTMTKRPVEFLSDSETSEQSENNNTRLDLIIPLVILALCLLLSLAVIIYQRRRFQNNNRKESHKLTSRQADQTGTSDSAPKPPNSKQSMEVIELTAERVSYVNDDTVYESPDDVIESIERNEAESKHEITTEEETSAYISLTDHKEPENFYQPLQTLGTSVHPHDTKGVDDQSAFNLNVSPV
ncbi:Down syndrome cell adhesion molecule homolog isoform X1, partial [Paramuricea clavata]